MKRHSVLDRQSVNRGPFVFKKTLGQLGFGLIKVFIFLLGLGGLSLACISGSQLLTSSPYFGIRNIVVTGIDDDLRQELIKMSGLKEGESLLSIDPAAVKRNIEAHPWVKSALLKKELPHTLHIKAEHEEPVAIVLLGQMYLMDGDGITFKEVEMNDPVDFPVVTGLCTDDRNNGAYLKQVASFLHAFCSVEAPISEEALSEVHVQEGGALSIYFSTLPFKVVFGKDDFIEKIKCLTRIIEHLRVTHRLYQVRSIDLGYRDRAVVAFKEGVV